MRIHVLVDAAHEVLAYVPARDSAPRLVLAPVEPTHTVYENIQVSESLADLRGDAAFRMVHEHLHLHLEILRGDG